MKVIRLATIYLDPYPNPDPQPFRVVMKDVIAETLPVRESLNQQKGRIVLVTQVILSSALQTDNKGFIRYPIKERRECEWVIEEIADLLAVAHHCKRTVSSPTPPAAFIAENEHEQKFLNECNGVLPGEGAAGMVSSKTRFTINLSSAFSELKGRERGTALMAEAYSHSQASGRYHELIRIFELAFSLPVSALAKKLAQYLEGACMGYTRQEIAHWFSFRDGAAHADLQKSKTIVLESDVRPFIRRMEQAALDVLFNKALWHDPSRERRATLAFPAATTSSGGELIITEGAKVRIMQQLFDIFGVYPLDLSACLTTYSEAWWWKPAEDEPAGAIGVLGG